MNKLDDGKRLALLCAYTLMLKILILLAAIVLSKGISAATYTYDASAGLATTYPWIDISASGTAILLADDQVSGPVALGFTFNFGGTDYTTVKVSSNGQLMFGSTNDTTFVNATLPQGSSLNTTMFAYWDDLHPNTAANRIRYRSMGTAPNRYLVVSYLSVPHFNDTSRLATFQIQLYEDGKFVYRYGASTDSGASATSGYQIDSSDYVQYSYDTATLTNNKVILWQTVPATLLGEYHLEETSWNGTAGEVKDSSGNNRHGKTIGSPKPTSLTTGPARTGATGTCGYASLPGPATGGGAVEITGLPVSLVAGDKTSVSFWMYWDGREDAMPVGWHLYDLWFASGKVGFNTNQADVYGINSAPLANSWHHVVAIFTNGSVTASKLYIDGTPQALSQSNTPYLPYAVVQSTLEVGTWTANADHRFSGRLDEVKVYNGALSQAEITSLYNETHTCTNLHHIRLEHTGTGSICAPVPITVKACADAACSSLVTSSVTATLSTTGGSWATNPLTFTGSTSVNLSVPTPQTVTLGTSSVSPTPTSSTVCYVGGTANCNVVINNSALMFDVPHHVAETSQSFTLTPLSGGCTAAFSNTTRAIQFTCGYLNRNTGSLPVRVDGNALNTGNDTAAACDGTGRGVNVAFNGSGVGTLSLQYADVGQMLLSAQYTGSVATSDPGLTIAGSDAFIAAPASFAFSGITAGPIAAGNTFSATVTARNSAGNTTPNFGRESVPEGVTLSHQLLAPTGAGAVTGSFSGSLGSFTGGSASGSNLTFSEVGHIRLVANLTSANYLGSGLTASGTSASVGEFVPHHFNSSVTQACDLGGFTYSGQPFSGGISARNASNAITQNYDGSVNTTPNYAKTVTISAITLPEVTPVVGSFSPASYAASNFNAGSASITPTFTFTVRETPPRLIALRANDVNASSSGYTEGIVNAYSGRLNLKNAYGAEILALPVHLDAEYWNMDHYWELLNLDNCTTVTIPTAGSGLSFGGGLVAGLTVASMNGVTSGSGLFWAGDGRLSLSKPSQTGHVDITIDAPSWLEFSWKGAGNVDPTGRANFGLYRGDDRIIYMREVY